ncbi:unnamed protein product, partial [Ectocarpus sp. 8 AP-2014]
QGNSHCCCCSARVITSEFFTGQPDFITRAYHYSTETLSWTPCCTVRRQSHSSSSGINAVAVSCNRRYCRLLEQHGPARMKHHTILTERNCLSRETHQTVRSTIITK